MRARRGIPEAGSGPYRGADRRQHGRSSTARLGLPFVAAVVGLSGVVLLLAFGPLVTDAVSLVTVDSLPVQLDAAAVAVAVLAGVLCIVRWRATGEATAMWLGAALIYYGVTTVGLGHLAPHIRPTGVDHDVLTWAHPASRIAVLWLLYRALRTPDVDAGLRLWPALVGATGLTAVLTVAFQVVPGVVPFLVSQGDRLATVEEGGFTPRGAVLVSAWAGVGIAFAIRALRQRRWLFAWFGVLFVGLAAAELLRIPVHPEGSIWLAGPSAIRFLALLCGLTGATRELVLAFHEQQGRLLESVTSERTHEARRAAEQRAFEERAHEARNALTAIEGATRTLQRYQDQLDEKTREALTDAVTQEIARLQQLVSAEPTLSTKGHFRLADVVAGVATAARSHGVTVNVDLPSHLVAYGRPAETGQVVQNLVENARRYAPGSPIYINAEPSAAGVELCVEDEGPGVPADERDAIFRRGHRGSTSHGVKGTGLGLYVSQRFMREQGGRLSVRQRGGGGASFAMWLPADDSASLSEEVGDEPKHTVEGGKITPLFRVRRTKNASGSISRFRGEDDDDVRNHAGR